MCLKPRSKQGPSHFGVEPDEVAYAIVLSAGPQSIFGVSFRREQEASATRPPCRRSLDVGFSF